MFGIDDAALAILAAGAMSTAGSLYANKKNVDMQNYWNGLSVDLANSAHQREVADLYLAGLNPILSAGGNGASTPTLTSPKVENALAELGAAGSNSAKYFSKEYDASVAQQELLNDTLAPEALASRAIVSDESSREGKIASLKNNISADYVQSLAARSQAESVHMKSVQDREAMEAILENPSTRREFQNNLREGILAAAKDATNVNWRNNVGAVSGAVTSAAGVVNAIGNLRSGFKSGKSGKMFDIINNIAR